MRDLFWLGIAAKLIASAAVVVLASLVAEATGPLGAAMIASLPITAGPSYVLLAMDHDSAFVAATALAGLAGLPATAPFIVVYATLARPAGLCGSLLAALAAWAGTALLLRQVEWTLPGALAMNTGAFLLGALLSRHLSRARSSSGAARRWWEIPVRATLVAGLVGTVLVIGRVLGPSAAGLATVFPLTMSSLVLILHPRLGWQVSAAMLVKSQLGLVGFGFALALVTRAAPVFGAAVGLALGLCASVAWNLTLLILAHRERAKIAA
ncbi:hypothetical protein [Roseixanthobacter pseudopolyaromaticivorans]|uniref:hypothetical protein n=1 Tax=Xanthobacteraceae TaxID=335928 RepID=UPI0037284E2C